MSLSIIFPGTTWMNAIVIGIQAGGDRKAFYDAPLEMKSPFLCRCEPEQPIGTRPIDILKKRPPGRTFFTHLAYQALPESIVKSGAKVWWVISTVSLFYVGQVGLCTLGSYLSVVAGELHKSMHCRWCGSSMHWSIEFRCAVNPIHCSLHQSFT